MKSKYVYNLRRDKKDHRDFHFKLDNPVVSLPESVDNTMYFPPVYDQSNLGSCSAFSSAKGGFEMLQKKELIMKLPENVAPEVFDKDFEPVSALFQYQNTLKIEGSFGQDNGAEIRDAIKSLATYGVCREKTWPYDLNNFSVEPPQAAYDEAANHKISQYHRCYTANDIMAALAQELPVIGGIAVYESFESEEAIKSGIWMMPNTSLEQMLGGHAICLAGYDKDFWLVRNSWGEAVGINGYFKLAKSFIYDSDLAMDFWAISK